MRIQSGSDAKLGSTWDGRGTNFAIFSAHADKIELCLFDPDGRHEIERITLPERHDDIWHGYLSDVAPGQLYGYRVHGPYEPLHGHRFNPHKLLLDPYAKRLDGELIWHDALYGYRFGHTRADLTFDRRDSARYVPKSVVVDDLYNWGRVEYRPRIPWAETFIYEAHVKGLTKTRSDIAPALRGTYRGLVAPEMISHLKRLGVTTIELLPIHGFVDDRWLVEAKLRNYWGYNSLAFFAATERYSQTDGLDAFRSTVARLHDAGFEVILDVVYNHTAEGDHLGPTLSFRGIDNASYYRLRNDGPRYNEDVTGCGNTVNVEHPRVMQMVLDSLRYWVEVCHVDGFRFDLAPALGRNAQGFSRHNPFFTTIRQDPSLAAVKLIAEPWDLGSGGYQVGEFPAQWTEWNDQFRHTMRRFWRGDGGLIGDVSTRMSGSANLFNQRGRKPWASINHVTVHDGFTLADLYSYETKHNEANGEDNRDGTNHNISTNFGVEGQTENTDVLAQRRRARKNQLATLMLAQGVPLLLAGDEVANSQNGNNNTFCQDNHVGWVDWSNLGTSDDDHTELIGALAAMRHDYPQLQSSQWRRGRLNADDYDVLWLTPSAHPMTDHDWNFPGGGFLAYLLPGPTTSQPPLYIILNASSENITCNLPVLADWPSWKLSIDTSDQATIDNETIIASAHSVIVLAGTAS